MTHIFRNTELYEPFTDLQVLHIPSAISRGVALGLYYYIHENVEEPVYEHVTLTILIAVLPVCDSVMSAINVYMSEKL